MREMMDAVGEEVAGEKFRFLRVAITPEASPDFTDLRDIIQTVTQLDPNDAVLVSDQLVRSFSSFLPSPSPFDRADPSRTRHRVVAALPAP